jgi:hypothetical protein
MDLVSVVTVATLLALVTGYLALAYRYTLNAMSLPCMSILTSIIYFYFMPALAFSSGEPEFLGIYIESLDAPHFAVLLYSIGAILACLAMPSALRTNPARPRSADKPINTTVLISLFGLCAAAILYQAASGLFNLLGSENYRLATEMSVLQFVNLAFTTLVTITVVALVKYKFNIPSLILLVVVAYILLQSGFRYRLVLLAFAATASFLLVKGIRVRTTHVLGAALLGIICSNAIGMSRTYGSGIDLSDLQDFRADEMLRSFGGEVGPIFSFYHIASNPLPPAIFFQPWTVGVTSLIPRFLWPDKPYPEYLELYQLGFGAGVGRTAGVAAPQHVEMLLQFGWAGLPILAFIYFALALILLKHINRLHYDTRIVGFALVPLMFGFYMQSRGYFFQFFSDCLFAFGPLFLLNMWLQRRSPILKRSAAIIDR